MDKPLCLKALLFAALMPFVEAGAADTANMPLKSISLFSSGTGCFLREGTVEGNRDISLNFTAKDINDLLKSLIVADLNNGKIAGIRYSSKEPVAKALGAFTIDLSKPSGLPQLMQQARGLQVEIITDKSYKGVVLSSEYRDDKSFLNIMDGSQIHSIPFESVTSLKFTDTKINNELSSSLGLIAAAGNSDKKTVAISCIGSGKRTVQAMYLSETPVWKMTYRLIAGTGSIHQLQGWAIVENTTDEDWKKLRLELVSGNPVSFGMDLYQPIYNTKPFVSYYTGRNIDSVVYNEGIKEYEAADIEAVDRDFASSAYNAKRKSAIGSSNVFRSNKAVSSVETVAKEESVGQFFSYRINEPVSIDRQKSAMLPVVDAKITGERIVIYNENVMQKNPLNAIMLINSSGVSLSPGPVTVYEDGIWAGDARIDTILAGGKRLISFSADGDIEALRLQKDLPGETDKVSIKNGVLYASRLLRKSKNYTFIRRSNKKSSAERILVEHTASPGWQLKSPMKPEERTENLYRFAVKMPSGKDGQSELNVVEEKTVQENISVSNMDNETMMVYIRDKKVSGKIKSALENIVAMKKELNELIAGRQTAEKKLQLLREDQERIRGNMSALSQSSGLYEKYAGTLTSQEGEIEGLLQEIRTLQVRESEKRQALNGYISSLDL